MIQITHRHMAGGIGHQHIARVYWAEVGSDKQDDWTTQQMVAWIDNQGGDARVNGYPNSKVHTVAGNPKYLRAAANGYYNDNLLALPTY